MMSKWKISVPGKLMIAGEYAILEPKQHGIVIAVNRYVTSQIKRSKENVLSLPQIGLYHITWRDEGNLPVFNRSGERLTFIQHTIEVMNQFLREYSITPENLELTITSELADNEGRKYGLGSSAAIVVAVVASFLTFHSVQLSKEKIFKLAAIVHLKAQGNGSGADIAASTFGGWIDYTAFSSNWVLNKLEEGWKIRELIKIPWPNLTISPLMPPSELELCVGWTTEVARTGPMIQRVQKLRITQPPMYEQFLQESSAAVSRIVNGFDTSNYEMAITGISQNRQALRNLGKVSNVSIETPKLKKLCDLGDEYGKAKSSGAGGGDCGIAFIQNHNQRFRLQKAWENEGIVPLHLDVSNSGLIISELFHGL